jgi:hypothetical protein
MSRKQFNKSYSDLEKLNYYDKRTTDKNLSKGKREYAEKRVAQLINKINDKSSKPKFNFNIHRLFFPKKSTEVKSDTKLDYTTISLGGLYNFIKARKRSVNNPRVKQNTAKKIISKYLDEKEKELDDFSIENQLDENSTILIY